MNLLGETDPNPSPDQNPYPNPNPDPDPNPSPSPSPNPIHNLNQVNLLGETEALFDEYAAAALLLPRPLTGALLTNPTPTPTPNPSRTPKPSRRPEPNPIHYCWQHKGYNHA